MFSVNIIELKQKVFHVSVPNSAHLLALVDENGSLVIYDTNKYGEKALLKGKMSRECIGCVRRAFSFHN